jgi:hypothetical protein
LMIKLKFFLGQFAEETFLLMAGFLAEVHALKFSQT